MADFGESIDDSELRRQLMHYTGREVGPITATTRSFYVKKLNNLICAQNKDSASMRSKFQNPRHEPPISKKPYNSNGFSTDRPHSTSTKGFSSDESDGEFSSRPPKSSRLFDGASKFSLTRPSLRSSASSKYLSTDSGHRAEGQSNGWTVHKNHKTKSSDAVQSSGTRPEPDGVSQNISLFVLAAGGLFFMTVAYVYIYWGYNAIVFNDPRDSFIICPKNANSSDACVKKQDLRKVQNLVESIIQLARSASGDCECGYRQHASLTRDEIERFVSSNSQDVSPDVIFEIFYANVHWETRTYDKDRKISLNSSLINFIETEVSRMSLLCMLKKAVIYALSLFGVCSFVALFCLAAKTFWSARQKRKEIETRQMNEIMERVIDVLKQHSDLCELKPQNYQPWLPVLNIRDLIIPLGERKALRPVWQKAIKQLRSRESRMAWKMDFVAGEECEVIRWLPLSLNKNQLNGNAKTWQGSAIGGDSPKKVINKLYPPLTSCLKVRNMFDLSVEVGDGWKTVVRDAILEKVGVDHGIVHIEVDGQSKDGCVYVRCKDENSAGQAFTNLHGWWFDGRLVTVKYLRLQRFIERFPDTMDHDAPLRPSNPARLSLSVPAHSSILENS